MDEQTWSYTVRKLGLASISWYRTGYFLCPIFGHVQEMHAYEGFKNLKIFFYYGYTYYVKEVSFTNLGPTIIFGLFKVEDKVLMPIMSVVKDTGKITYYDIKGRALEPHQVAIGL